MSTFDVRPAEPGEYAAVGDLVVAGYSADGFLDGDHDYAESLRDTARRAADAEIWVAASGANLLGAVTYCPLGSAYREVARDDEGEFRALAVSPAARGAGVGAALTGHCLDRSRAMGFTGVALCSLDRMTTAHRLYQRAGFVRDPARDWSPYPGTHLLAFALHL